MLLAFDNVGGLLSQFIVGFYPIEKPFAPA
jgi:hypothetical protein